MFKNPYYWTCPYCGANLDPGERCDCKDNDNHKKPSIVDNYKFVQGGEKENVKVSNT